MMMAVLFFLFFFSGVVKETMNDYDVNHYFESSEIKKQDVWQADRKSVADIVLIGSKEDDVLFRVVSEWAGYTKRKMTSYKKVQQYKLPEEERPQMILIDSSGIDYSEDLRLIQKWGSERVPIVFCNLPDPKVIKENKELAEFLGIRKVYAYNTEISGVEIFGGFLLGGDTIYEANTKEEKKRQDFDLNIPWYQTTSGIKAYIVGLMEDEEIENEYLPAILWRNSSEGKLIFAMNGDYMESEAGLGILSAIVTECKQYDIYPIVNSQNLVLANFAGLADENEEKMEEIYSRSQTAVFNDIVWPSVQTVIEKNKSKVTCLLSVQQDYEDGIEPDTSELVNQLRQINEVKGEAGLSTSRKGKISVKDKLEEDRKYMIEQYSQYEFSAYYTKEKDLKSTVKLAGTKTASNLKTVTTDFVEGKSLLSFVDDDVTLQRSTIDGTTHTFTEDMRVKSIQTALGYSNILVDMGRISWPKNKEDHFEKLAEKFTSYTNTYWRCFDGFAQTPLSESDRRVRRFLALEYSESREDNTISLDVENTVEPVWFLLRTHGEKVKGVEGGSYKELEEDAYLIQADEAHMAIELEEYLVDPYYYIEER